MDPPWITDRYRMLRSIGEGGTGEALLVEALRSAEGNVSRAAKLLGLNRRSLYKKMRRHGIRPEA